MEFKEYRKKTLERVKRYLEALAEFKAKDEKAIRLWLRVGGENQQVFAGVP